MKGGRLGGHATQSPTHKELKLEFEKAVRTLILFNILFWNLKISITKKL